MIKYSINGFNYTNNHYPSLIETINSVYYENGGNSFIKRKLERKLLPTLENNVLNINFRKF